MRILVPGALALLLLTASTLSADEWNGQWFSEESRVSTCPNGYALVGLRCAGRYCDNKQLICRSYGSGYDPTARYRWSRSFSEEPPSQEMSDSEVVSGMSCAGRYCDNLQLRFLRSPRIENTRSCRWTQEKLSEEERERQCPAGRFVSGIRCQGPYCDDLFLYCCDVRRR